MGCKVINDSCLCVLIKNSREQYIDKTSDRWWGGRLYCSRPILLTRGSYIVGGSSSICIFWTTANYINVTYIASLNIQLILP